MWNPTNLDSGYELRQTQLVAQSLSVELQSLEVRSPDELGGALAALAPGPDAAVVILQDALMRSLSPQIADVAAQKGLPTMFSNRDGVQAGGLMFYGASAADAFRRAAGYVDKILRGARPADLPVELPITFDLVINVKAAESLGLSIPRGILEQATELIQ